MNLPDPPHSDQSDDELVRSHAQRALELIRLELEGETDQARLLFDTVPAKDYLGLAAAAIGAAASVCKAAGSEFCLAIIEDIEEVYDDA